MRILKHIVALAVLLATSPEVNANSHRQLWSPIQQKIAHAQGEQKNINFSAKHSKNYRLDILQLQTLAEQEQLLIELPLPNGQFVEFLLTPNQVLSPQLAEKYPQIKTFSGVELGKPSNKGRFDLTVHGFRGMFNQADKVVFIDPKYKSNNVLYASYYRSDAEPLMDNFRQLSPRKTAQLVSERQFRNNRQKPTANELITYRIAVAATAEYTAFHGGTKQSGLAAIVTMINRVNQVYAQDLNIQMQLVANNDAIVYTDPATDPFEDNDGDIDKVEAVLTQHIGNNNYDIGHIVGTGGGGLAGFGVVCTENKWEGLTGSPQPTNDAFNIDFVAHEIGHQFMADHTFNGGSGGCKDNRSDVSGYEPGSASTIMGYAGLCQAQDLQSNSDPYFHIHSIDEMSKFITKGAGKNCGVRTAVNNSAPVVNAGSDYTIPARTPFVLTGSATDANGDSLIYSWEQYDLGPETTSPEQDATDNGSGPLFRVWVPTSKPTRTLPRMQDVLNNTSVKGEALPSKNRELNFRLVVRDQKGGLADDAMKITVVGNDSGFKVVEPSANMQWNGSQQNVQWNTAGTEQAPVSCNKVEIALSTDSGASFEHNLGQHDNTGSAQINLPTVNTDKARLKLSCSNNIFFAVNNGNFRVASQGSEPTPVKPVITGQKTLTLVEDSSLMLTSDNFNYQSSQAINSISLQAVGGNYQLQGSTVIPNRNFNGSLNVTVIAKRGELESEPFTATILVTPVNDIPVAVDDSITVEQDASAQTINVLANDSDVDGDTLSISNISYSGNGQAAISNGAISYTPASGFNGNESFSYQISDGNGGSATANVSVTVNAAAPAPTPTPTPEPAPSDESSSGGSMFYGLLSLLLLCRRWRSKL